MDTFLRVYFLCEVKLNHLVQVPSGSLCSLHHRSLTWIISHDTYLLCSSSTIIDFMPTMTYLLIFYTYLHDTLVTMNLTKIMWLFNRALIPTHNNW